ncbi:MAG: VOC family protein [Clostridia bacterium]|nr:VOC family protein [Clostridia bacterium]
MKFKMVHNNLNVRDLDKSLAFYKEALGLEPVRWTKASDGSFTIVYLGDGIGDWRLELTYLTDHKDTPYELGENEIHLAFETDDYEEAFAKHQKMGCVCFVNESMGIYFIEDPDGYWLEILPSK